MSRFLFTMMPVNDLGLPTRMLPIARVLADRGHEVGVFNPAPAPMALIAEAGLNPVPMPDLPLPEPGSDMARASKASTSTKCSPPSFPMKNLSAP